MAAVLSFPELLNPPPRQGAVYVHSMASHRRAVNTPSHVAAADCGNRRNVWFVVHEPLA